MPFQRMPFQNCIYTSSINSFNFLFVVLILKNQVMRFIRVRSLVHPHRHLHEDIKDREYRITISLFPLSIGVPMSPSNSILAQTLRRRRRRRPFVVVDSPSKVQKF
ncbi:hypothetical protein BC829DRAFT_278668 [Chytridium lagenaria]|nr:hypothetical protein BC829DRAFT_278668 [Chytridium lagenaria]